jgi:hypothetical protein
MRAWPADRVQIWPGQDDRVSPRQSDLRREGYRVQNEIDVSTGTLNDNDPDQAPSNAAAAIRRSAPCDGLTTSSGRMSLSTKGQTAATMIIPECHLQSLIMAKAGRLRGQAASRHPPVPRRAPPSPRISWGLGPYMRTIPETTSISHAPMPSSSPEAPPRQEGSPPRCPHLPSDSRYRRQDPGIRPPPRGTWAVGVSRLQNPVGGGEP